VEQRIKAEGVEQNENGMRVEDAVDLALETVSAIEEKFDELEAKVEELNKRLGKAEGRLEEKAWPGRTHRKRR
jgi:tetrahydromethanopterin S-methyltransferase subunit B